MQSLFDIAIERCGAAEAAYSIAQLNGLELTAQLLPEQVAELRLPDVVNPRVVGYFRQRRLSPSTPLTDDDLTRMGEQGGIGFWRIEETFRVG